MKRVGPIAVAIVASAAFAMLSGCGGGSTTSSTAVPVASAPSPPIIKAQATTYAHAVNLHAADLRGLRVAAPERESRSSSRVNREDIRCAGFVHPERHIVNIRSAIFTTAGESESEEISSAVEVFPSPAVAVRHNATNQSQRALACAARYAPRLFGENTAHIHYGPVAVTRLPDPMPGVPGSFGIRFAATILGVRASITPTEPQLYIDVLGFLSGPAEVNLIATGLPEPVSDEAEQHLLSVLYSRAAAHTL